MFSALSYYREKFLSEAEDVAPSTVYRCPECGSENTYRAASREVSFEEEFPEIGVEALRIKGLAECSECRTQVILEKVQPVELVERYDEEAWKQVYQEKFRSTERTVKVTEKSRKRRS